MSSRLREKNSVPSFFTFLPFLNSGVSLRESSPLSPAADNDSNDDDHGDDDDDDGDDDDDDDDGDTGAEVEQILRRNLSRAKFRLMLKTI